MTSSQDGFVRGAFIILVLALAAGATAWVTGVLGLIDAVIAGLAGFTLAILVLAWVAGRPRRDRASGPTRPGEDRSGGDDAGLPVSVALMAASPASTRPDAAASGAAGGDIPGGEGGGGDGGGGGGGD